MVCAIKARHRWCLTGTPIQNYVEDLGAILQFLQVYPFDSPPSFAHEIADWIRCGDEKGMQRLRLLVNAICLRRTKDCLGLPPRKNEREDVELGAEEMDLYEICKKSTVELIEVAIREDGKLKSFATVVQLILRLRQICSHGKEMLSNKSLKNIKDYKPASGFTRSVPLVQEIALCGICERKVQNLKSLLPCMHPACGSCFEDLELSVSEAGTECLICAGTDFQKSNCGAENESAIMDRSSVGYRPSSKVDALLRNLHSYVEEATGTPIKRYAVFVPL